MLLVTGECERIIEREAGSPENTWTERTIVVRDWGQTLYVTVARDFRGSLPGPGERIALDVSVRSYVSKRTNEAGHAFTGFGRNAEAEKALFSTRPAAVSA